MLHDYRTISANRYFQVYVLIDMFELFSHNLKCCRFYFAVVSVWFVVSRKSIGSSIL